jgi:hypothetical protein
MVRIAQAGRRMRRKPRSPEEREVIVQMAAGGMQRRVTFGRLVQTGPRAWTVIPLRAVAAQAVHAPKPAPTTQGADR